MPRIITGTTAANTIIGDVSSSIEYIYGGGGNDILSGGIGDMLYGGIGNDILKALSHGVMLAGGAGNDTITGFASTNGQGSSLYGGAGIDTIYGGGKDVIYGGLGADKIIGSTTLTDHVAFDVINETGAWATQGITVDLVAGTTSEGDTLKNIAIITATAYNDKITGGLNNESFDLGEGDDLAYGGAGNDSINGGMGNDSITGGAGNDSINGGMGNDSITGGAGNDNLLGDTGEDFLYGGDGNDFMNGGEGDDVIYGGAGNDNLQAGLGDDVVYGGDGDDFLYEGDNSYSDIENGSDILNGGNGNDTFSITQGQGQGDLIIGGNGIDTLELSANAFSSSNTVTINLTTGVNSLGMQISGIENLSGAGLGYGYAPVNFTGDANANVLTGGTDNDTLSGMDGNDILDGGEYGVSTLYGGSGNDILKGAGSSESYIYGDDGDDILIGNPYQSIGCGKQLFGGNGNDVIIIESCFYSMFNGGAGADTFVFELLAYHNEDNTITDFSTTSGDVIRFEYNNVESPPYNNMPAVLDYSYIQDHMAQVGNNVVIYMGGEISDGYISNVGTQIILENVQLSDLSANDFGFV